MNDCKIETVGEMKERQCDDRPENHFHEKIVGSLLHAFIRYGCFVYQVKGDRKPDYQDQDREKHSSHNTACGKQAPPYRFVRFLYAVLSFHAINNLLPHQRVTIIHVMTAETTNHPVYTPTRTADSGTLCSPLQITTTFGVRLNHVKVWYNENSKTIQCVTTTHGLLSTLSSALYVSGPSPRA